MRQISRRRLSFFLLLLLVGVSATARAEQPDLVYETSIPGYFLASGRGIVVDDSGNAYAVGSYYADQMHLDIMVFKLGPDGEVLWTKTIEGAGHDYSQDIAIGPDGGVWIVGWTDSADYPITPDAMDASLTGFRDAALTRFSPADGTILYSTFLGGDYTDEGSGIAFDSEGNIVLVGTTGSTDFPTTADAWQGGPSAPLYIYTDAFVTRLDPDGRTILYSTYFGGFRDDTAGDVAIDSHGDVVFSGSTTATDLPLADPIQSSPNDIFVSKLSADGSSLLFSTYLGGEDVDRLWKMGMGPGGDVYLAGATQSIDFPTTPGSYQEEFVGGILACGSPPFEPLHNCYDGFVTRMATDGRGLLFSTFLGGSWIDEIHGVAVDLRGSVHVAGQTSSDDFPGTIGPGLIFLSELDPTGGDLRYTLRRESPYAAYAVATDRSADTYVTGAIDLPARFYVAKYSDANTTADAPDGPPSAAGLSVGVAAPNPFVTSTRISYSTPTGGGGPVRVTIHDASGRIVRTLVDGGRDPGPHTVTWDGMDERGEPVPSGIYFYTARAAGERRVGHLIRIR